MHEVQIPGKTETLRTGKVICIGRNYAKHAFEMGGDVPDEPWVFLKPSSAIIRTNESVVLPPRSHDVHHEVELVALIGKIGKDLSVDEAPDIIEGYAVGLDMTARDLQTAAKAARSPWSIAKGFDTFAPLGPILPAFEVKDPQDLKIRLSVNGEIRQSGSTRDMIFSVAELISFCSECFTLFPGDLLYPGTPDGVGPVHAGDELIARIEGLPDLSISVIDSPLTERIS